MNSRDRQWRVLGGHPQKASLLPLVPIHQRLEELRQQRALVEKAIALLTEVSRRRDLRRQQAVKS